MPWVSVDDAFYEHPKFARVGPLGIALWVAGLAYCNRNLTDGLIPYARVGGLIAWQFSQDGDDPDQPILWRVTATSGMHGEDVTHEFVADLLVSAGLWEPARDGFRIHDYHEYQPTKKKVLSDRAATRDRVSRWRRNNVTSALRTPLVTLPPNPKEAEDVGGGREDSDVRDLAAQENLLAENSADRVRKNSPSRNGTHPDGFETWYRTLYPRRVKPDLAERAYRAALRRGHTVAEIHDGTRSWAEHWEQVATEMQHIPYPASFLNGGQFRDPPPESAVLNLEDPL